MIKCKIASLSLFISVVALILLTSCAVFPLPVKTPSGPIIGDVFKEFRVLGVSNFLSESGNRPNAERIYEESRIINVPPGTETVVVAISGWGLGYGEVNPEFFLPGQTIYFGGTHRHYGQGILHVTITELNPPNMSVSPLTQTAKVRTQLILTDKNFNDPWWGFVRFSLIFLGTPLKVNN